VVRRDKKRNVWVIDFRFVDKSGVSRRYRKDALASLKKDAELEERRLLTNCSIYGGPFAPVETTIDGGVPFSRMVHEFREGMARVELKTSTRAGYDEILNSILLPRWGDMPIKGIDFGEVQKLDAFLVEREASPSRRRNVQIVVRTILHVAVDLGRMSSMPKLPALPRVGKTVVQVMTHDQVDLIIQKASLAAVWPFCFAAYCGLRAGEIRALRWSNIDLSGWLIIAESVSHGITGTPKSGNGRKVPIPLPLLSLLRAYRGKVHPAPDALVCLNGDGKPWGETGLTQAFLRASKRAGVEGFSLHDLRHWYVTMMFRAGVPAPTVQAMAGHSDLATTQRYAHSSHDDAEKAGAAFGEALTRYLPVGIPSNISVGNIGETDPANDTDDEA